MGTFATSWTTGDTIPASELNTLSGAWDTYTPSVGGTGFALGNGTISGRWKKVGRVVAFSLQITWGSTSTYGAGPLTVSAPTAGASTHGFRFSGFIDDTGASSYDLAGFLPAGSSTITLYAFNSAGTHTTLAAVTSTIPHTWANTDVIRLNGVYESST